MSQINTLADVDFKLMRKADGTNEKRIASTKTAFTCRALKIHFTIRCSHWSTKWAAIFGKVGRAASAEVMVQLFNSKCLLILYYGTDVCPLTTKQINSLQFVIHCVSKKTRHETLAHNFPK